MTIAPLAVATSNPDPDIAERAYLKRRALDKIQRARAAVQSVARLPHDMMARAYCARCRSIVDLKVCPSCELRPLCLALDRHRAHASS